MILKKLPFALITGLMFLFFACQDKPEAVPVPAMELDLSRAMVYDNGVVAGINYGASQIESTVSKTSDAFNFYSGVPHPVGNDHISFKVATADLKPGFVGEYSLKSTASPNTGDATFRYVHYTDASRGAIFESTFSAAEGSYTITAYDAKHKLITGTYEVVIRQAMDPYFQRSDPGQAKKVDITISGTFKNVKLP